MSACLILGANLPNCSELVRVRIDHVGSGFNYVIKGGSDCAERPFKILVDLLGLSQKVIFADEFPLLIEGNLPGNVDDLWRVGSDHV